VVNMGRFSATEGARESISSATILPVAHKVSRASGVVRWRNRKLSGQVDG